MSASISWRALLENIRTGECSVAIVRPFDKVVDSVCMLLLIGVAKERLEGAMALSAARVRRVWFKLRANRRDAMLRVRMVRLVGRGVMSRRRRVKIEEHEQVELQSVGRILAALNSSVQSASA